MTTLGLAAFLYHILSRLAYVGWVGGMLRREERTQHLTQAYGAEEGFRRFRTGAAWVMNNDAVSFLAVCAATWGQFPAVAPPALLQSLGLALIALGIGVKLWARSAVGADRYYWRDFFGSAAAPPAPVGGPYRYLRNPMYTVGNLHLAGLALVALSLPGLIAAAFSHAAILVFNYVVERPHVRRLYGV